MSQLPLNCVTITYLKAILEKLQVYLCNHFNGYRLISIDLINPL